MHPFNLNLIGLPETEAVNAMNATSSREMGFRNKYAEGGDALSVANPEYQAFQHSLDLLGFPEKCRKVALTNGSNNSLQQIKKDNSNLELGDYLINRCCPKDVWVYALVSDTSAVNIKVSGIKKTKNKFFWNIDESGWFSFSNMPSNL